MSHNFTHNGTCAYCGKEGVVYTRRSLCNRHYKANMRGDLVQDESGAWVECDGSDNPKPANNAKPVKPKGICFEERGFIIEPTAAGETLGIGVKVAIGRVFYA